MNLFELTRTLIDLESITGNERQVGIFLNDLLASLAAKHSGRAESVEIEPDRFNVFACWGKPVVTLSTHMDTVPPHVPSREDGESIWGRGACDTKGIIAFNDDAGNTALLNISRNFINRKRFLRSGLTLKSHDHHGNRCHDQ